MDRRTKIILLIVSGLIVIGIIVALVFWFFPRTATPAPINVNRNIPGQLNVNSGNNASGIPVNTNTQRVVTSEQKGRTAAQISATTFAERVTTYSNQDGLAHFTDLKSLTVPSTYGFIQGAYRKTIEDAFPPRLTYYGMTSKVISATALSYGDTAATFSLSIQRVEEESVTKTSYATLRVDLIKQGGGWLVDNFKWQ